MTPLKSRVPLIKSILFLRDLKGIVARCKVKLMALVLNKLCNAANVPFRSRPKGLTGLIRGALANYENQLRNIFL